MDNSEGSLINTKHKAVQDINNGNILLIPIRQIKGQDYLLLSDVKAMAPTTTALLHNGKMIPFEVDPSTLLELVPKRASVSEVETIWQLHTPTPLISSEATATLTQQQQLTTEVLQRTMHLEQQFNQLLHRLDQLNFSTENGIVPPLTDQSHHHQQHNTDLAPVEGNTEAEIGVSEGSNGPISHLVSSCQDTDSDHPLAPHTTSRSVSPPPAFSDASSILSASSSSSSLSLSRSNPQLVPHPSLIDSGRRTSNAYASSHQNTSIAASPTVSSPPAPSRYQEITTAISTPSSSSSPPPILASSLPLIRTTPAHRRRGDDTMTSTSSTSSPLSPEANLPSSSNGIDDHEHTEISAAPPPSYETSIFGTIKALIQHIRLFEHHIPNRHKSPRWLARRAEWVGYEPQTIDQVAFQLVQLEMALLWTAVTESWIQERETWLTLVASARTERHLAGALVSLERHTLVTDEAWQSVRDDWTSELLEVIVSVGF